MNSEVSGSDQKLRWGPKIISFQVQRATCLRSERSFFYRSCIPGENGVFQILDSLDAMMEEYELLFSVRDFKPAQQPPLPPVKGAVPLFNTSEIQLGKRDTLLTEEKYSSAQGGNPFRKATRGKDC